MSAWPHVRCSCSECHAVARDSRAEQRAEAKRRLTEILAMRPRPLVLDKSEPA